MENNPGKWRNIGYSWGDDRAEGKNTEVTTKTIYCFDTGFLQANMPFVPVNFSSPPHLTVNLPFYLACSLAVHTGSSSSLVLSLPRLSALSLQTKEVLGWPPCRCPSLSGAPCLSWGHCDQLLQSVACCPFMFCMLSVIQDELKSEKWAETCMWSLWQSSDIAQAHF